jgi:radical SAM protein with 4Fe4S-binding SPASM domain
MGFIQRFFTANAGLVWETYYKLRRRLGMLEPPELVQWLTTHACNFKCEHCGTNAGEARPDELTTAEVKGLIDELADMGTDLFALTGGEPFMRPDLFDVLEHARSRGVRFTITTNGSLVPQFERQLREITPCAMMISVDGLGETHNEFRKESGSFAKCLDSMKILADIGIQTRAFSTTLNQQNVTQLEQMFQRISRSGATYWRLQTIVPEGRAENKDWLFLTKDQWRYVMRFIVEKRRYFDIEMCEGMGFCGPYERDVRANRFFCGSGWNTCIVLADGKVAGCPAFRDEWIEGSIREHSFAWLWHNKFQRFRNLELDEECRECEHVSACRGGCWMLRRFGLHCFKEVWDDAASVQHSGLLKTKTVN